MRTKKRLPLKVKDLPLASGPKGRYEWHWALNQVVFYEPRRRRPSWEYNLPDHYNTENNALRVALKHSLGHYS